MLNGVSLKTKGNYRQTEAQQEQSTFREAAAVCGTSGKDRFSLLSTVGLVPCYPVCPVCPVCSVCLLSLPAEM